MRTIIMTFFAVAGLICCHAPDEQKTASYPGENAPFGLLFPTSASNRSPSVAVKGPPALINPAIYTVEVPGVGVISMYHALIGDVADVIYLSAGHGFPEPDSGYWYEAVDVVRRKDYTGMYEYTREVEGAGIYFEYVLNDGSLRNIELLEMGPRLACGIGVGSYIQDVRRFFPNPVVDWKYPDGMKHPYKRDSFPEFHRLQVFGLGRCETNPAGRYIAPELGIYYDKDDVIVAITLETGP